MLQDLEQELLGQVKKHVANVSSIGSIAEQVAGDKEVPSDRDIDSDFAESFFDAAKNVSSEELQELWGRVLAGEVERPGSISTPTLEILKTLYL